MEITVLLKCSDNEFKKQLQDNSFVIVDRIKKLDCYFFPEHLDYRVIPNVELFNHALILCSENEELCIVRKIKDYDSEENILCEEANSLCVSSPIKESKKFLESIGYKEFFYIEQDMDIYEKNGIQVYLQRVYDGDNKYCVLEFEKPNTVNGFDTPFIMSQWLSDNGLSIDESNLFIKKGFIAMDNFKNKTC